MTENCIYFSWELEKGIWTKLFYPDVVLRYKQGKNKDCFAKKQYFL